jgi:hypothetical protein
MAPKSSRLLLVAVILLPEIALLLVGGIWFMYRQAENQREALYRGALAEIGPQLPEPGLAAKLPLSGSYRSLTHDGTVDVVRTKDRRLIVLFKTTVGWKDNYTGEAFSDAPFQPGDFSGTAYNGINQLNLSEWQETPFIRTKVKDHWLAVYFDLG